MRAIFRWSAVVLGLLTFPALLQQQARAQVNIEIGGSNAEVRRNLSSQGYTDVRILKRSFTATTAEGCLGGVRYTVKILITGHTKWRKEIGRCRSQISIEKARSILQGKGFDRIDLEERRNGYVAIACLREERLRVSVDRYGDVRRERRLGRCRSSSKSPTDVASDLKDQGYSRIRFIDRQLPRYKVQACLGLRQMELVITGIGEIIQERNTGRCQRAINPRDLPRIVQKYGFTQVKVIDAKLPRYVVEACRKNRLSEITLNRFGKIIDQFDLGRCARPLSRARIIKLLQDQGATRIRVNSESQSGFDVTVCRRQNRVRINLSIYGEILREKNLGACNSRTIRQITKALKDRQFKELKFFAEGCRKGRRIRIDFDQFGDPVGRQRLGRC